MASGERHAQRRRSFATGNPFPSNVRARLSCSSSELSPGGTPDACARCAPRWGKNATLTAGADDTIVRTINPRDFNRATRSTSRQVNRLILLNLVREFQPISRADLARRMTVGRGMVTTLVKELLAEGAVYEGALADAPRGRRPKMLHVQTRDRLVVAIDIRFSRTYLLLSDFAANQLALESFGTVFDPVQLLYGLECGSVTLR